MRTNNQIINSATITTGSVAHGLLNPEQARKFIQQTFEATNLGGLVRHVMLNDPPKMVGRSTHKALPSPGSSSLRLAKQKSVR